MYKNTEKYVKPILYPALKQRWQSVADEGMQGWDFSKWEQQMVMEKLPWDYFDVLKRYRTDDMVLLDLGTGGGVNLLEICHPYALTSVTEGYRPNYELCLKKLSPLGIKVQWIDEDGKIPYDDQQFDIVINRHESYDLQEVKRVLKPGGYFISQQVGANNNYELASWLIQPHPRPFPKQTLKSARDALANCNFQWIEGDEIEVKMNFLNIDVLVWYATVISWEFEGFSVEAQFERLIELYEKLQNHEAVYGIEHRYYFVARKEES